MPRDVMPSDSEIRAVLMAVAFVLACVAVVAFASSCVAGTGRGDGSNAGANAVTIEQLEGQAN